MSWTSTKLAELAELDMPFAGDSRGGGGQMRSALLVEMHASISLIDMMIRREKPWRPAPRHLSVMYTYM